MALAKSRTVTASDRTEDGLAFQLVSVVVATFDDIELTSRCVASLRAQTHTPLEIILVDNGSRADIARRLAGDFPGCTVLRNSRNLGFAGGYNRGLRAAGGRYIAILNNDAVAHPEWIARMVDAVRSRPRVGAVAALVVDGHRPAALDSCGLGIALDGMSRQVGTGRPVDLALPETEVLAASGCACLFDAEALARVGLFDESFFAYCEDVDLALRLRWAGYETTLAPAARVLHYHSMTAGRFSLQKVYWVERNHFWVTLKSFPWPLLPLVPAATLWRYVLQARAVLNSRGEVSEFASQQGVVALVGAILRAHASCLAGLPRVLAQRRTVMRSARVSPCAMVFAILRFRLPLREILRVDAGGDV
jgi:GT2 family glycosyltransferase